MESEMIREISREIRHARVKKENERQFKKWVEEQESKGLPSDKKTYKKHMRKMTLKGIKENAQYDVEHPVETAAKALWFIKTFK